MKEQPTSNERCINWPCAMRKGHVGPCSTSPEQRSSKERVYAVCEYLRGKPCSRCSSSVDTPYGKGVQGCYAVAEETIAVVERTRTTDEPAGGLTAPMCPECGWVGDFRTSPPPSAWRPIETAPTLGKWVLLWWPDVTDAAFVGYCVDGQWRAATSGDRWPTLPGPTHWMPLPEGPSVTKDAGECGACDKPGEHCANVHGICSRHGGRAHETKGGQS